MLTERQKTILDDGAKSGLLPTNVACKVGCRFCYEKYVKRDYDNLEFRAIPRYSDEAFEYFMQAVDRNGGVQNGIRPDSITSVSADVFHMGPNADFFTLGLTVDQIDRIIAAADPKRPLYLYATGLDVEPDTIRYLTAKHGPKFVLRLSAITFHDALRSSVVQNSVPSDKLKRIIEAASIPRVMLMGYSYEQLTDDLRVLNELTPQGVRVLISMLQVADSYPEDLKEMAKVGFEDFPETIAYLAANRSRFENFHEFEFLYPPEAYAWKARRFLQDALKDFGGSDIALCSGGAENVVRFIAEGRGTTRGIPNPAGGSIDFATTLTTQSVLDVLRDLGIEGQQSTARRVFVPSNIWWVKGKYDLEARTANGVREACPGIELVEVQVPSAVVDCCLTLDECVEFYSHAPLQRFLAERREQADTPNASASNRPYVSGTWAPGTGHAAARP